MDNNVSSATQTPHCCRRPWIKTWCATKLNAVDFFLFLPHLPFSFLFSPLLRLNFLKALASLVFPILYFTALLLLKVKTGSIHLAGKDIIFVYVIVKAKKNKVEIKKSQTHIQSHTHRHLHTQRDRTNSAIGHLPIRETDKFKKLSIFL